MRNLFILHTQYNLILATGVLSQQINSNNTLVLFSEFQVTDAIKESLNKIFDRVIIVSDSYHEYISAKEQTQFISECLEKTNCLNDEVFDQVYMSQENFFDTALFDKVFSNNPKVHCFDIEEDAYYSLNEKYNTPNFRYKKTCLKTIYRLYIKIRLSKYRNRFWENVYFYGMNSIYKSVHLLFPALARKEIQNKELIEIKPEAIITGIERLYSNQKTDYPKADSYMVMFFDLMSRYQQKEEVLKITNKLIDYCTVNNIQVLIKYHPRETEKFDSIKNAFQIDQIIPGEKVLVDLKGKKICVFGNATTTCIVAAKLGHKVISIAKLEKPNNTKMHKVMELMGIKCVNNEKDIERIFEK